MKVIKGLLDYTVKWSMPNVYLFTGNGIVKNNGAIVMGRGAAKQVRDFYPGIDKAFGRIILKHPDKYLLWHFIKPDQMLGWFKVKNHWQQPADLKLIHASAQALNEIAYKNQETTFHMNFPGVGNGRLKESSVINIITTLPDNVRVYR